MITKAKITDYDILYKMDKHISKERLRKKIEDGEILLLIKEEKIIGWLRYGYFWDEYPFMNMLFIIDEYRGKGFGKKLVEDWEEKMAGEGHRLVMTSTLSNEEAQHFYRRLGYVDIGGFIIYDEPLEILLIKNIHS
ncbi:Acetyltransferase (GNAT) family protein [Natronincola peptidivorans]|uniref:Acetyltransferase (GNAT) family protein n=1 Tax=Natronincola peptidivorans TaxID=426128 RepID=A0A1I0EE72_9FIRM|nr:GNAT family N-acetyltransferase [Natronincola peptidivorans]SET42847.1 Acetyltransferase (GNAT) family protein [Natronincola peptidivorans]